MEAGFEFLKFRGAQPNRFNSLFAQGLAPGDEGGDFAGCACQVKAAAAAEAGVDASETAQLFGPLGMKLASQAAELVVGMLGWVERRSGDNSCTGPTGFAARLALIDHVDRSPVAGQVPRQRESNHATADDQNVVHEVSV
jgi:hypothetical protein